MLNSNSLTFPCFVSLSVDPKIFYLSLDFNQYIRMYCLVSKICACVGYSFKGIPGLDESYLPRYIGYAFGFLLVLNHFLGSDSSAITTAQLRTEVLGLLLAVFSVIVPYLGKFLKGSVLVEERNLPEDAEQAFVITENISDILKEDLAWGTYVLLRNTSSISVLFSLQDTICARGYWRTPKDVLKAHLCDWFEKQIQQSGLHDLKETLYFPQVSDSEVWEMLPKGTRSLLVQPLIQSETSDSSQKWKNNGFVLVASSNSYAYNNKDRSWVGAVAKKFGGKCSMFTFGKSFTHGVSLHA